MKTSVKIILPLAILAAGSAFWYRMHKKEAVAKSEYVLTEVNRGDIQNTISSTGTLFPVSQVEVGTQVSGRIEKVYVDYNAQVRKGEVLAVLDTTLLAAMVRDQQAGVLKAKAQAELAQTDYTRNQEMYDKKLLAESDLITSRSQVETTRASLESAQIQLENAKTNLAHAVIRSPLDGKVVNRNVEAGQTVAASFSTPTLFTIAEDLSKMEIHAMVDESDIGQVKQGQPVSFSVEAYYDKKFDGSVRQVRLQPTTLQNVVNYTVVIDADNKEGLLLPGMTATVEFILEQKKGVLKVPNAALSFKPPQAVMDKIIAERRKARQQNSQQANAGESGQLGASPLYAQSSQGRGGWQNGQQDKKFGRLWMLDDKGELKPLFVEKGITDGSETEIVRGRDLSEGMQVIKGFGEGAASKTTSTSPNGGPPRWRLF